MALGARGSSPRPSRRRRSWPQPASAPRTGAPPPPPVPPLPPLPPLCPFLPFLPPKLLVKVTVLLRHAAGITVS